MIIDRIKNNVIREAEEKVQTLSKIRDTDEFVNLEGLYKNGISPVKREEVSAS